MKTTSDEPAQLNPKQNYEKTRKEIGYVPRKKAKLSDYQRIGFMSGLEVHQQLKTKEKLFCHCPAGIYHNHNDFNAEIIRHMRPTLSELGEYDGTALMEQKTRKEIIYRINNKTACTYEIDDTPPFKIDREALEYALEISLLCKLNIVGEVHITRKQYLDGSIPTGFQRTAILGVEGEIPLKNKKVRLIQLSIEEDSCREISDIRHTRIYKTDRLGMPLIETVTYPELFTPEELKEAAQYIRFLNRSTGKVRTGIGAGREDVNVSCKGGTRVEIKGVAHNKWIPELSHNEAFRQWALLNIREKLNNQVKNSSGWKIKHIEIDYRDYDLKYQPIIDGLIDKYRIIAVNLPDFKGIMSHFTQPGKMFADEICDRLKVIACLEKPNMTHSEEIEPVIIPENFEKLKKAFSAGEHDAQLIFWAPDADIKTALEVIEERCKMAFEGVPKETRKGFADGTTIFERVLPGADRMYPDTDSAPIPLEDEYITKLSKRVPTDIIERYNQLKQWDVPEDTYTYIFRNNLYPLIERIVTELKLNPKFVGSFIGHRLKFVEGHNKSANTFDYDKIYDLFKFLIDKKLEINLSKKILPVFYQYPKMDFNSILTSLNFKQVPHEEIISKIPFLKHKFSEIKISKKDEVAVHWIMGELQKTAIGNIAPEQLAKAIEQ
ncbi:MAG: glutamyl-tRNA(Gln) amidotransferase subunit E [Bacteroidetes bacterium GWC2_33_15]|nr:MAG: glutamyl-tRNA(Gln) amidotransferase subunit E [Bacteroidetes bacterium GWA2_33_15]OFX50216.1 MAG: glutamyl-tRNA(Gln) amidotransferase subunit E [Bacteroidetes bacterium GWC2_33_15]OFX65368.1 MAG: glutamyl-tRNA(Gln) amidotransferase subunit E [Bacteroidetes bacterium GWB2_32_14]OFX70595.1 MAG: glutamyl-tRNA(Gln) amidotransferase subunit E [Bacteroidetes bacterium GWD2_33_33]HAN19527.1 Glu-tRNA(Gln) amidotransferase GatDE subunit E [Bacteroidales bacterium]